MLSASVPFCAFRLSFVGAFPPRACARALSSLPRRARTPTFCGDNAPVPHPHSAPAEEPTLPGLYTQARAFFLRASLSETSKLQASHQSRAAHNQKSSARPAPHPLFRRLLSLVVAVAVAVAVLPVVRRDHRLRAVHVGDLRRRRRVLWALVVAHAHEAREAVALAV